MHQHSISRRSLVAALGAAIPAAAVVAAPAIAAEAFAGASPRLLELKRKADEAWARQQATRAWLHEANVRLDGIDDPETRRKVFHSEAYEEIESEWEDALDEAQETAREALLEPTVSPADLAVKLAIWENVLAEYSDFDDDLSEYSGWIDRALPRLFNDARALLEIDRCLV